MNKLIVFDVNDDTLTIAHDPNEELVSVAIVENAAAQYVVLDKVEAKRLRDFLNSVFPPSK